MKKMSDKQKANFILFCVLLFFVGIALISVFFSGTGYYTRSYTPVVEQSAQIHRSPDSSSDTQSDEPRPAGFRESEIHKQHGNRYDTY